MTPIVLTLSLVAVSTLIAAPLGVLWGWSIAIVDQSTDDGRLRTRVLRWFSASMLAVVIAMLALPLYIHAAGWEGAAGKFGWFPALQGGPRFWFRGLLAAGWIHGAYGACWVAIAVWWVMRRNPRRIAEASRMDAGFLARQWYILMPISSGWIIAAIAWSGLIAATEMTVADLYGVGTLSDMVYKVYALDPEPFPVVASICFPAMILLPPLLYGAFKSRWFTWNLRGEDSSQAIASPSANSESTGLVLPILLAIGLTFGLAFVPVSSLIAKAGWTVQTVTNVSGEDSLSHSFSPQTAVRTFVDSFSTFATELAWTAQLAVLTIVLAVPVAWLIAGWCEGHRRARGLVMLVMLLCVLIPGPVVSLFVIQTFNRPTLGMLYDRTLLPSVIAVLPKAIPVAFLILRAGYRLLDSTVIECAVMDGCGLFRRMTTIDGPRLWRCLLFAIVAVALVAAGDLSATLLVLPPGVSTVASRLFGLLHSGVRQQEAGLALITTFCVGCLTAILVKLVR